MKKMKSPDLSVEKDFCFSELYKTFAKAVAVLAFASAVPAAQALEPIDDTNYTYEGGSGESITIGEAFAYSDSSVDEGTSAIYGNGKTVTLTAPDGKIFLYGHYDSSDSSDSSEYSGNAVNISGTGGAVTLKANSGLTAVSVYSTLNAYGSGSITVVSSGDGVSGSTAVNNVIQSQNASAVRADQSGAVSLTARDSNELTGVRGIEASGSGTVSVIAEKGGNTVTGTGTLSGGSTVTDGGAGISAENYAKATVTAETGSNTVSTAYNSAVILSGGASLSMTAYGSNTFVSGELTGTPADGCTNGDVLEVLDGSSVIVTAETGDNILQGDAGHEKTSTNALWLRGSTGEFSAENGTNRAEAARVGVWAEAGSTLTMEGKNNYVSARVNAVVASDGSEVTVAASEDGMNTFILENPFSSDTAVVAAVAYDVDDPDQGSYSASQITISGPTTVYGNDYALRATSAGSTLELSYGQGSSLEGSVDGLYGGAVSIKPLSSDDDIQVAGDLYGRKYISQADAADSLFYVGSAAAGSVDAEFINASSLTGSAYALDGGSVKAAFADTSTMTGNAVAQSSGAVNLTFSDSAAFTGMTDTGLVTNENPDTIAAGSQVETGTVNLVLNDASVWTMTSHSALTSLSGSGGTVRYQNGGDALEIETLSGSHTFAMDLSMTGSESDMLYIVNGTSEAQTLTVKNITALDAEMGDGDAVRFATIRNAGGGFTDGKTIYTSASGIYYSTFSIDYRDAATDPLNTAAYNDAYNGDGTRKPTTAVVEATYGGDGSQNVYVVKDVTEILNEGATAPAEAERVVWRALTELDTYTKRRSQTRYADRGDENGMWVRLAAHSVGVDGVGDIRGPVFEAGYKHWFTNTKERRHSAGAAINLLDNDGDWDSYAGSLAFQQMGFSLYHTMEFFPKDETEEWKKDAPLYWDSYLKFGTSRTRYSVTDSVSGIGYRGSYHQRYAALSTEVGKKFPFTPSFYIVPQAQVHLGWLGSYSYKDSQDLHIKGDSSWSAIGRLGFDLVKRFGEGDDDARLYAKASVLHQFSDGTDVTASSWDRHTNTWSRYADEGDESGTWGVVGAGFSCRFGKGFYGFVDGEYVFGNDFTKTYVIRGSLRSTF
jgi:outer membrane autotransporter protein